MSSTPAPASDKAWARGHGASARTATANTAHTSRATVCARKRPRQLSSVSDKALATTPSNTGMNWCSQSAHQPSPNTPKKATQAHAPRSTPS